MKILVTGGAGFIGSHLCRRLLAEKHEVICVDNFCTGSRENVLELMDNSNFELIYHDISIPLNIEADQIYSLACPASPIHYQRDPIETIKTSILGSINMLDLSRRTGATVLQASTSEVYGDPEVHPQTEAYLGNVNCVGVRACYDEGKRCAETLFFDYSRQHKVDIRVARIFNTYGPYMHPEDGRVVSNFIVQALSGRDITVYGSGGQTRSFQYVDDLVTGLTLLMNNNRGFVGPVNLGNPKEYSIRQLADQVLKLIPESKSRIVFKPLPSDDPRQRKPEITLAAEELGWRPKCSLEQGLLKTIDYFREKNKISQPLGNS